MMPAAGLEAQARNGGEGGVFFSSGGGWLETVQRRKGEIIVWSMDQLVQVDKSQIMHCGN